MNGKRLKTLMKKDMITCFTNKSALMMLITPLFFCLFYTWVLAGRDVSMAKYFVLLLACQFNLSIAPVSILATLIAEEKEAGTMGILYRTGVGKKEFLCAKMAAVMVILMGEALLMFVFTKMDPAFLLPYLLLHILIAVALLPVGLIVAVIARDQNSANVYSTIPVIVLMACPVFSYELNVLRQLSAFLPTSALSEILVSYMEKSMLHAGSGAYIGKTAWLTGSGVLAIICCVLWFCLGTYVFLCLYRRKGFGDKSVK